MLGVDDELEACSLISLVTRNLEKTTMNVKDAATSPGLYRIPVE